MATPETTPIERAFELAKSGRYKTTDEIRQRLKQEGYSTERIAGPWLMRQLRTIINEASAVERC